MDFQRNQPTEYKLERPAVLLRLPSKIETLAANHLRPIQPLPASTGRTKSSKKTK